MKLLLDQNLSPYLVDQLADLYPDSVHVQSLNLDKQSDDILWTRARMLDFTIVSKDEDFSELSLIRGFPPKVIWLQLGNCTTAQVETALRSRHAEIETFHADPNVGIFVVS